MTKHDVLRKYFGHSDFRPGQEQLIDAILDGRDALGIMPTGGGKSLCYQVPGLLLEGITLVISPLISLMKDQVMALTTAGVPAAFLNSSLTLEQQRQVFARMRDGAYKLVYVAPERLDTEGFVALAQSLDISLVAVDEAHCISQWGQDFRPSYLRILDFLEKLSQRPPLAAFTATATAQVREDIVRILELREPECVLTGFDRPNLYFEVQRPKDRTRTVLSLVSERKDRSGIIYCATRPTVEKVCDALREKGIPATRYHAGLTDRERRQNQEDFLYDRTPVMVATNAFGMGIDKANVSYVLHYNMPKSLEAYYQEAGRAGRDGSDAECILLYAAGDAQTAKHFIFNSPENEALTEDQRRMVETQDLRRLEQMVHYCQTNGCLRGAILDYFGQEHQERCDNCGNCLSAFTAQDITQEAQMILSCVKRIQDRVGYSLGAGTVIQTLTGSRAQRLLELGLDELSTYGIMKGIKRDRIQDYITWLEQEGYLKTHPKHGGLSLIGKAGDVLFRGEPVVVQVKQQNTAAPVLSPASAAPAPKAKTSKASKTFAGDPDLLAALKALRLRLSQRDHIPIFMVFSNASLEEMATRKPGTLEEFLSISGVGEKKAEKYGQAFLAEIEAHP